MTVPSDVSTVQYTANGVTTSFNFGGRVLEAAHLDVYLDGVLQASLSGYTVDNVGSATSDVVFDVAPALDVIVTITRNVPVTQTADYVEGDAFPAETHERALDKLTMICQQIKGTLDRSIRFAVTLSTSLVGQITEAPVTGRVLIYLDTLGNIGNGPNAADIADAQANAAVATAQAVIATEQAAIAMAAAAGMKLKASVKAASTGNLTLSGAQTVDGIALIAGDRVLVKDQSTGSQNGIYEVAAGAWTRPSDANTWAQLVSAMVTIEEGTVNADTTYVCTANQGGTIGVTTNSWSVLITPVADGSITYAKLAAAAFASTSDILNSVASKIVNAVTLKAFLDANKITIAGKVVTTSGTNIDFPSIPSWAKRISLHFVDVSTNGTNSYSIQGGVGGVPETTGYTGSNTNFSTSTVNTNQNSISFAIGVASAAAIVQGRVTLELVDVATNTWDCTAVCSQSNTTTGFVTSGNKAFAGVLDMIRLTAGGNTFDGGYVVYCYE